MATVVKLRVVRATELCSYSVISSPIGNICRVVSTAISTTYWSHVHNTPDWAVQTSAWLFTTSCILSVLLSSIYEMQLLLCSVANRAVLNAVNILQYLQETLPVKLALLVAWWEFCPSVEGAGSLVAIMEEQVGIRGWNSQYSSLFPLWIYLIHLILE